MLLENRAPPAPQSWSPIISSYLPLATGNGSILPYCVLMTLLGVTDAFIPARAMENLVNGYRLRWNVTERSAGFPQRARTTNKAKQ